MDLFSFISLFGGLAFFLYGMNVMSTGLEKMAGSKLQSALTAMTSNKFKSLVLGAIITIAIQSSSALTVMLVGLVNSGIMNISQTIGVIMGSNIGTTLTAWILSLTGIESESIWMNLLKPENFSLIFALIGIIMIMMCKKPKQKDIGSILVGFAVLMFGMKLMSDSVSPLADMPQFSSLLTAFENPILGVLVGALFTGVIQSSAASVGILQALSLTGTISYGMAIPIIMGQNIGTCVTALISSIGVNKNAKKVAAVHISFNIIGTVICLIVFYSLNALINFAFVDEMISPVAIAGVHSIFNIVTTVILLPFTKQLEKIANFVIKDKKKDNEQFSMLDERLLNMPAFAISKCFATTVQMSDLASKNMRKSISLLDSYSEKSEDEIIEREDKIDMYEDKLSTYLVKLSNTNMTESESLEVTKLLHTIGDFERIGDHAVNLLKTAKEIHDKKVSFSDEAKAEISVITNALTEIISLTAKCFEDNDVQLAKTVEPLEQVIDSLVSQIRAKHTKRLLQGNCSIELGFILSDLLTNYERVSDHCSNIAVALIEIDNKSFGTHQYLSKVKSTTNLPFMNTYNDYMKRYSLKNIDLT